MITFRAACQLLPKRTPVSCKTLLFDPRSVTMLLLISLALLLATDPPSTEPAASCAADEKEVQARLLKFHIARTHHPYFLTLFVLPVR
jgi:hypothetical protein